ncbi:YggS family pyridoxal phosphate-dependent enzyme [Desulfonatronum thioautotrophicum]|uniref:YggS family pyridoxal phosphate-dependent enzyme n=1 Tax=Desulfonatronum thioautotrophicum TaxID=617001 RepID=UPI0005EB9DD4|nr:YggS family pyridoxal phosphate-dependent enzyme [Desulfonatronum thioautotrophicum]
MDDVGERYARTRQYVDELALRHGRTPNDVQIIAVSKYQPAAAVAAVAEKGQCDFGENYVQEALRKQHEVGRPDLRWHFLGRLQRNKVKYLPGHFSMFHALDDAKLALDLHKKFHAVNQTLEVLIQVNVGQEPQKGGVLPRELPGLVNQLEAMPSLLLRGLMTLPPFDVDVADKQRFFSALRNLRNAEQVRTGWSLPELSMGTTDDFPQAIAEGATMVRIGTRIFGDRPVHGS